MRGVFVFAGNVRAECRVLKMVDPGSPFAFAWASRDDTMVVRPISGPPTPDQGWSTNASGEAELVSVLVCPTVNSGTLAPLFDDRAAEATLDPDFPSRDLALGLDPARVVSSRCAA